MKYILLCTCSGIERKAEIAYDIIYPNTPLPPIVKGKEAIARFAADNKNDHLRAVAKLNGRYAYYIDINENGKIIEEYDLLTGRRIA